MKQTFVLLIGMWILALLAAAPAQAILCPANTVPFNNQCLSTLLNPPCPPDSVKVGATCVDKYEASVWQIPANNQALINKVIQGKATLANLTSGGAVQRGVGGVDDYPCDNTGNACADIYAVSIPGVKPSADISWFQAQQACGNSGKRLLRNGEWQQAAAGTPDPGTDNGTTDCNITNDGFPANDPVTTGSRSQCISRWGTFDMVGNVWEWVEDWVPLSTACVQALFGLTGDLNCLAGASTMAGPGALIRGGLFALGADAGVFAVSGSFEPSNALVFVGFRCGR